MGRPGQGTTLDSSKEECQYTTLKDDEKCKTTNLAYILLTEPRPDFDSSTYFDLCSKNDEDKLCGETNQSKVTLYNCSHL